MHGRTYLPGEDRSIPSLNISNIGENMSKFTVGCCDRCGDTRTPTFINANRVRLCKRCDPPGFEEAAKADIEAWLRGEG